MNKEIMANIVYELQSKAINLKQLSLGRHYNPDEPKRLIEESDNYFLAAEILKDHITNTGEDTYLSHLTDEQRKKIAGVAAEVIAWGNGKNIRDIQYGIDMANKMTPLEQLDHLDKDNPDWLWRRLGFDPYI